MPPPFIRDINLGDGFRFKIYGPNEMLWESLKIDSEDDLIGTLSSTSNNVYKTLNLPCEVSYGWVKKVTMTVVKVAYKY